MSTDTHTLITQLDLLTRLHRNLTQPTPSTKLSVAKAARLADRAFADETYARVALKGALDVVADALDDDQAPSLDKTARATLGDGDASLGHYLDKHADQIRAALKDHGIDGQVLDHVIKTLVDRDVVVTRKSEALHATARGFGVDVSRPIRFEGPLGRTLAPRAVLAGRESPATVFTRAMAMAASHPGAKDLATVPPLRAGDWFAHGATEAADHMYGRALEALRRSPTVRGADGGIGALIAFLVIVTAIIVGAILASSGPPGSTINVIGTVIMWLGIIAAAIAVVAVCSAATAGTCAVVVSAGAATIVVPISTCGALCP